MISVVLKTLQDEFKANWVGIIHFEDGKQQPSTESWIHLDVEPIANESLSFDGCTEEQHGIYVTCYARNKVQAASLADNVTAFICNRKVGTVYVRSWSPIIQGKKASSYFYKIRIDSDILS